MSDLKDKVLQEMEQEIELDKKEAVVKENRINSQFERIQQNQKELSIIEKTKFGTQSPEQIHRLINANDTYIESARNPILFINETFRNIIPFFRKNLILIGGKTGEGKSTTVANIILETIRQTNPLTGKKRRVLVITNEEKPEDFYNRVTCLIKGYAYTNHDQFTDVMVKDFREGIALLAGRGLLTVIDDNFGGTSGMTTTIEGIQAIFDSLIRDEEWYDVVILDYYQNIKASKKDPSMDINAVQARLAAMLDNYKNIYPAPIVIMAQVNPNKENENTPFEYRIKGRKVITDPATLIMEMIAEREHFRTRWIVHKSRFTNSVGADFYTGFDRGRYVIWNNEFMTQVLKIKETQERAKLFGTMDKASGAELKAKQEELNGKSGTDGKES